MDTTELVELALLRAWVRSGDARAVRLGAGLSLREVGDALDGASPSTILRWERGERQPRGEVALKYCRLIRSLMEAK